MAAEYNVLMRQYDGENFVDIYPKTKVDNNTDGALVVVHENGLLGNSGRVPGEPNGVATLDAAGHIPDSQLTAIKLPAGGDPGQVLVKKSELDYDYTWENMRGVVELESIAITSPPERTKYKEGELFSTEGLIVTGTYTFDLQQEVTGYTVEPSRKLTREDKIITIRYSENGEIATATYPIEVIYLESIGVTKAPDKVAYKQNENFDKTGMAVTAFYSDNTEEVVTNYTYSPMTLTEEGMEIPITISYTGPYETGTKNVVFNVSVGAYTGVTITEPPDKITYRVGEEFDPEGMVVTANYSNGIKEVIINYDYTPKGALSIANTIVTVSYNGKSTTYPITVANYSRIEVSTRPNKTAYFVGESFSTSGMEVRAVFSNEDYVVISDYDYFPKGALSSSNTIITISYSDLTTTTSIEFYNQIVVTSPPNKTSYNAKQTFVTTGMVVKAQAPSGTQLTISDYDYSPKTALSALDTRITISYKGMTTTQNISVARLNPGLSVSPTSVELNSSGTSKTVNVSTISDGTLSVRSNNTSIATVSLSGKVVTIKSVNDTTGETTVTISVSQTNYYNAASVNVNVSADFIPYVLNNATWAQIRECSDNGTASSRWAVGDAKQITINGTIGHKTYSNYKPWVYILGFNHNSLREGNNKIHFGCFRSEQNYSSTNSICLDDSKHLSIGNEEVNVTGYFSMNASSTNSGGWESSQMRTVVLNADASSPSSAIDNSFLKVLPSELKVVLKQCIKYSDNVGGGGYYNEDSYITSTVDWVWLLSEFEVHGWNGYSNKAERNYLLQYDYYKNGNSTRKYLQSKSNMSSEWWTRSVMANDLGFCTVADTYEGAGGTLGAAYSIGFAPGFCV